MLNHFKNCSNSGTPPFRNELKKTEICSTRGYRSAARKNGQRALDVLHLAFAGAPFVLAYLQARFLQA